MARDRLLYGWLSQRLPGLLGRIVVRDNAFHGLHGDGWIGPSFMAQVDVPAAAKALEYRMEHVPQVGHNGFEVVLSVDGTVVDRKQLDSAGPFSLVADVSSLRGKRLNIEIRSASYFVPREIMDLDDNRELSVKLYEARIEAA